MGVGSRCHDRPTRCFAKPTRRHVDLSKKFGLSTRSKIDNCDLWRVAGKTNPEHDVTIG
jgi:hypothetical protein